MGPEGTRRVHSRPRLAVDSRSLFLSQVRLLERFQKQGQRKYENYHGKQRHDDGGSNQGGKHQMLLALSG